MASYLVVKSNNQTKSYTCKSAPLFSPYMKVDTKAVDLTTETTTGLRLQVVTKNKSYIPIEGNVTTTSSRESSYTITTGVSGLTSETTGYSGYSSQVTGYSGYGTSKKQYYSTSNGEGNMSYITYDSRSSYYKTTFDAGSKTEGGVITSPGVNTYSSTAITNTLATTINSYKYSTLSFRTATSSTKDGLDNMFYVTEALTRSSTYYTESAVPGNMSSTTALTRESVSGYTGVSTRSSTSGYSGVETVEIIDGYKGYSTRQSTYGTSGKSSYQITVDDHLNVYSITGTDKNLTTINPSYTLMEYPNGISVNSLSRYVGSYTRWTHQVCVYTLDEHKYVKSTTILINLEPNTSMTGTQTSVNTFEWDAFQYKYADPYYTLDQYVNGSLMPITRKANQYMSYTFNQRTVTRANQGESLPVTMTLTRRKFASIMTYQEVYTYNSYNKAYKTTALNAQSNTNWVEVNTVTGTSSQTYTLTTDQPNAGISSITFMTKASEYYTTNSRSSNLTRATAITATAEVDPPRTDTVTHTNWISTGALTRESQYYTTAVYEYKLTNATALTRSSTSSYSGRLSRSSTSGYSGRVKTSNGTYSKLTTANYNLNRLYSNTYLYTSNTTGSYFTNSAAVNISYYTASASGSKASYYYQGYSSSADGFYITSSSPGALSYTTALTNTWYRESNAYNAGLSSGGYLTKTKYTSSETTNAGISVTTALTKSATRSSEYTTTI